MRGKRSINTVPCCVCRRSQQPVTIDVSDAQAKRGGVSRHMQAVSHPAARLLPESRGRLLHIRSKMTSSQNPRLGRHP